MMGLELVQAAKAGVGGVDVGALEWGLAVAHETTMGQLSP